MVKFSIYLNRRVFIMKHNQNEAKSGTTHSWFMSQPRRYAKDIKGVSQSGDNVIPAGVKRSPEGYISSCGHGT